MGGGGSSNHPSSSQQSIPTANAGADAFLAQFKDMMIGAMDAKLQQFKEDWVRENQREREVGNDDEEEFQMGQEVNRPGDVSFGVVWKDVSRHNPGTFNGGRQAEAAEEWIERLETIFQAITCSESQKARVAILSLTGEARRWWKSVGGRDWQGAYRC